MITREFENEDNKIEEYLKIAEQIKELMSEQKTIYENMTKEEKNKLTDKLQNTYDKRGVLVVRKY